MDVITRTAIGQNFAEYGQSYLDGTPTVPSWVQGGSPEVYTSGFVKPDKPIINPKDATGWRKPSSYGIYQLRNPVVQGSIEGYRQSMGSNGQYYDWIRRYGDVAGRVLMTIPRTPLNVNNVRMKVLNNLREEVLDVAMVLAEMQGTVDTVRNALFRVGRSMEAVRKRKPESFSYLMHGKRRDGRRPTDKFLRETAGTYLEWKYGVMPTIYDIEGACTAMDINREGSLFDNPAIMVARAVDKASTTEDSIIRYNLYGNSGQQHDVKVKYDYTLKARCDFYVDAEGLRGLNRYGLGLGTVATVAFDRTPFSFVLNMAVPIAELIKAWTALAGVKVKGYCETEHVKYSLEKSVYTMGPAYQDSVVTFNGGQLGSVFTRQAFDTVPMPVPFIRNPVKAGNLATVLSLFTQLRKPDRTK